MLVAFNVTQLEKWGYTNDTIFIDPMQPEFQAKPYNAADYTEEAIREKIAWFYSTNAYHHDHAAEAYPASNTSAAGSAHVSASQVATGVGNAFVTMEVSSSWTTVVTSATLSAATTMEQRYPVATSRG
jgi:bilirubin oxidase